MARFLFMVLLLALAAPAQSSYGEITGLVTDPAKARVAGASVNVTNLANGVSWPRREVPDFNVMLNDDGDWSFIHPDPLISARYLRAAVDALAGTGVKTYVRCVGAGSDVLYYPTKVASPMGWRKTPKTPQIFEWAGAGVAAGIDPIRITGEHAKKLALRFVPTYRMNDAHFAREPLDHALTGKFWLDHHQRLAMPNNRFDFSHREVREFRLAVIFEVLDRYRDIIDGIELDFNRHAMFFPAGKAKERALLITDMVARVRDRLAEMEKTEGRPFYLFVRVSPTLSNSLFSGLDVAEWMRRRIVDVVIPAQVYSMAHEMPIEAYVKLGKETGAKVYPAIYQRTQYTWPFARTPSQQSYASDSTSVPNVQLISGAASNYWALGVHGFETFNYRTPLGSVGFETHRFLANPAALSAADRVYTITPAHGGDLRKSPDQGDDVSQFLKQLPTSVSAGGQLSMQILIAEDLSNGSRVHPDHAALRLGLRGAGPDLRMRLRLNGEILHEGTVQELLLRVTGGPREMHPVFPPLPEHYFQVRIRDLALLRPGYNSIQLDRIGTEKDGTVTIVEVQLGLFYEDRYPKRI